LTFTWSVHDPDGDRVTCSLVPHVRGAWKINIEDCANNNSFCFKYPEEMDYYPKLIAADGRNLSERYAEQPIHVTNDWPSIASFTVSPNPVTDGEKVTFSFSGSDPDGDKITFYLDADVRFGDNNADHTITGTSGTWQTMYPGPGEYWAEAELMDEWRASSRKSIKVIVKPRPLPPPE
jgi:PKD domain-containing protein